MVEQDFMLSGKSFQMSGPECLTDLCVIDNLGFVRWKFPDMRVEYEWTELLNLNMLSKDGGSRLLMYLNIITATWVVFRSKIFSVLSL